jgi:hypothetical protein
VTWVKIRIRIRDEQPGSYFRELRKQFFGLKYSKFFDADPVSGTGKNPDTGWKNFRNPGWKKFGSGMEKIRIRNGKN